MYSQLQELSVEEKAHGSVSMKTYYRFFRAGASYVVLLIVLILFFTGEVS